MDSLTQATLGAAVGEAILGKKIGNKALLFGAIGGSADPRKGADLLLEALQRLRSQVAGTPLEQLELLVFGQSRPAQPPELGFPIEVVAAQLGDDAGLVGAAAWFDAIGRSV